MGMVKGKSPRIIRGDSVGTVGTFYNCVVDSCNELYANMANVLIKDSINEITAMARVAQARNSLKI